MVKQLRLVKTLFVFLAMVPSFVFADQGVTAANPSLVSEFFANLEGTWYDQALERSGAGAKLEISFEKQGDFIIERKSETVIAFADSAYPQAIDHIYESIWRILQDEGSGQVMVHYFENAIDSYVLVGQVVESSSTHLVLEASSPGQTDPIRITMQIGGVNDTILTATVESNWDNIEDVTTLTRR